MTIWIISFLFILFSGKPFYQCDETSDETGGNFQIGSPARSSPHSNNSDNGERFSRKVFVGGLPPDIDEGMSCFEKEKKNHSCYQHPAVKNLKFLWQLK
jgi:hypothetical protein